MNNILYLIMKESANIIRSRLLLVIDQEIKKKNPNRKESHKNYRIRFTESFSSSPIEEHYLSQSEKIEMNQLKEGCAIFDAKKSQKYLREICQKFKRDQPLRKKFQSGNLRQVMNEYIKDTKKNNENVQIQRRKVTPAYKNSLFKIAPSNYYNVQFM